MARSLYSEANTSLTASSTTSSAPVTLRKVSCWPAKEASGRSSAVAEERTATATSPPPLSAHSGGHRPARIPASSSGGQGAHRSPSRGSGDRRGQCRRRPRPGVASAVIDALVRSLWAMKAWKASAVVAKPSGTETPRAGQVADHLAQRGVLAADPLDVGHPQGGEGHHPGIGFAVGVATGHDPGCCPRQLPPMTESPRPP
jgi:hypothetical protein